MPEDKLLIAGIRPEYFEDASVVESDKLAKGATFRATIDVVEWLGNEAYAYIPTRRRRRWRRSWPSWRRTSTARRCARS